MEQPNMQPSIENRWGRSGTESREDLEKELIDLREIQTRISGALSRLNDATNADIEAEQNNPMRRDETSVERATARQRYNELLVEARIALRLPEQAQIDENMLSRYIDALEKELSN